MFVMPKIKHSPEQLKAIAERNEQVVITMNKRDFVDFFYKNFCNLKHCDNSFIKCNKCEFNKYKEFITIEGE